MLSSAVAASAMSTKVGRDEEGALFLCRLSTRRPSFSVGNGWFVERREMRESWTRGGENEPARCEKVAVPDIVVTSN